MMSGGTLRLSFSPGSGGDERGSGVSRTETRIVGDFQRIHVEGAGKARVHATEQLKARIEGAGLVTCRGTPASVEKAIDGGGRIRQAD